MQLTHLLGDNVFGNANGDDVININAENYVDGVHGVSVDVDTRLSLKRVEAKFLVLSILLSVPGTRGLFKTIKSASRKKDVVGMVGINVAFDLVHVYGPVERAVEVRCYDVVRKKGPTPLNGKGHNDAERCMGNYW